MLNKLLTEMTTCHPEFGTSKLWSRACPIRGAQKWSYGYTINFIFEAPDYIEN